MLTSKIEIIVGTALSVTLGTYILVPRGATERNSERESEGERVTMRWGDRERE
jgi:hypothetical protein